jgi:hypothetical protein
MEQSLALEISLQIFLAFNGPFLQCRYHVALVWVKEELPQIFFACGLIALSE